MRKVTLALGILYLPWSIWLYITIARVLSYVQKFHAAANLSPTAKYPQSAYLMPILIFAMAVIFIGGYFANFKNQVSYKVLAILGALGIIVYLLYIFIGGSIANKKVYEKLNEAGLQQKF